MLIVSVGHFKSIQQNAYISHFMAASDVSLDALPQKKIKKIKTNCHKQTADVPHSLQCLVNKGHFAYRVNKQLP